MTAPKGIWCGNCVMEPGMGCVWNTQWCLARLIALTPKEDVNETVPDLR